MHAYADAFEKQIAEQREKVEKIKGDVESKVKAIFDEFVKPTGKTGLDFNLAF